MKFCTEVECGSGRKGLDFGGHPDFFLDPGSRISFHDSLPLACRQGVNWLIAGRISKSYERISMEFFWRWAWLKDQSITFWRRSESGSGGPMIPGSGTGIHDPGIFDEIFVGVWPGSIETVD